MNDKGICFFPPQIFIKQSRFQYICLLHKVLNSPICKQPVFVWFLLSHCFLLFLHHQLNSIFIQTFAWLTSAFSLIDYPTGQIPGNQANFSRVLLQSNKNFRLSGGPTLSLIHQLLHEKPDRIIQQKKKKRCAFAEKEREPTFTLILVRNFD